MKLTRMKNKGIIFTTPIQEERSLPKTVNLLN